MLRTLNSTWPLCVLPNDQPKHVVMDFILIYTSAVWWKDIV